MNTKTEQAVVAKKIDAKCVTNGAQRVHYYRGMPLDERDLTEEQKYQNTTRQTLARLMHGCGILCGLQLSVSKDNCGRGQLVLQPGMALDGEGRLIHVREKVTIPVRELCKPKCCDPCGSQQDECGEPILEGAQDYCVRIRYRERANEPQKAHVPEKSGCRPSCEHSRIVEGWCLELVPGKDACEPHTCCPKPDAQSKPDPCKLLHELCAQEDTETCCAPCCEIALGRITIDCACDKLELIVEQQGETVRRYAWTAKRLDQLFAALCASLCAPSTPEPDGGEYGKQALTGKVAAAPGAKAAKKA